MPGTLVETLDFEYFATWGGGKGLVGRTEHGIEALRIAPDADDGYSVSWITEVPLEAARAIAMRSLEALSGKTQECKDDQFIVGGDALGFRWMSSAQTGHEYNLLNLWGENPVDVCAVEDVFAQTVAPAIANKQGVFVRHLQELLRNS